MKQRFPISYTEMLATQRTPPTFDIGAMRYFVDADLGLLREKDNRERLIYFSEMEDAGSHYKLTLQNGQTVDVPYMIQLDPEGVAAKYGVKVSELPAKDSELKCPPELLADRLQGKLPTLSFIPWEQTIYASLMKDKMAKRPQKNVQVKEKKKGW